MSNETGLCGSLSKVVKTHVKVYFWFSLSKLDWFENGSKIGNKPFLACQSPNSRKKNPLQSFQLNSDYFFQVEA